jgi:two-component system response regulator (stage 0 sporulation protein F)
MGDKKGGLDMATILLVDDERAILQYYSEELAVDGHEILTADSGDSLLEKISLCRPDVVVLDIKLGRWDGLDLLQDIRRSFYDMPVILCTAYETFKRDLRSMAADYYVTKSYDLSELKGRIRMAVEARLPSPATAELWLDI